MKQILPDTTGLQADPSWKIGIIRSHYYKDEIDALAGGAREALLAAGIPPEHISEYEAFGSFEIPLIGAKLAATRSVDALIGIGIIIQGETRHAELLSQSVVQGMMDIQIQYALPFAMEILHVESLDQARARASEEDHRGREAAISVLRSLSTLKKMM